MAKKGKQKNNKKGFVAPLSPSTSPRELDTRPLQPLPQYPCRSTPSLSTPPPTRDTHSYGPRRRGESRPSPAGGEGRLRRPRIGRDKAGENHVLLRRPRYRGGEGEGEGRPHARPPRGMHLHVGRRGAGVGWGRGLKPYPVTSHKEAS